MHMFFYSSLSPNLISYLLYTGRINIYYIPFAILNFESYYPLLYRHGRFSGKYTTRTIHTKLHPGPEWHIFDILTTEDIGDVISRFFRAVCVWGIVCLYYEN